MTEVMQAVSHSSPEQTHYPRPDPRTAFIPYNANLPSSSTSTIRRYPENPSNSSDHSTPVRDYSGSMASDSRMQPTINSDYSPNATQTQPGAVQGSDYTHQLGSPRQPTAFEQTSQQSSGVNPAPVPPPRTSSNHKQSPSMLSRGSADARQEGRSKQAHGMSSQPAQSSPRFDAGDALGPSESASKRPRAAEYSQSTPPSKKSRDQEEIHGHRTPNTPTRKDDAVINRVVITDPEVDRDRIKERMAESVPSYQQEPKRSPAGALAVVGSEGLDDGARVQRQPNGQSGTPRRKEIRFKDYILGATLGEGEFGKVKMGWKTQGGVQVAVKLIRRESVASNPTRLPKIYREISILRQLNHPNIVRLHEMVETEKHIGIVMEYASGGELFDYILTHRFLKDPPARRLFAQLISGVGYLHKKGIVHRDLKLENLLLDKNKNIIITDFGFANTFDPLDELGERVEGDLDKKDYIKKMALDKVQENGFRRGDLMQTSCGSPCYAAPELVVSDSLYTGRKVDVWSCGVILYAMLAGYLPFDDDPDNPEGDNINLLYKYIVTTPLTFPEYVTPHARDLLKRILVPNPRSRADLFEVARHSWLEEYSHITSLITSNATDSSAYSQATVGNMQEDSPHLVRSASVREPTSRTHQPATPTIGRLIQKQGTVDVQAQSSGTRSQRDAKRRTVQLEYVAPHTQTARTAIDSPTEAPSNQPASQATPRGQVEQRDAYDRQSSRPGTSRGPSGGQEALPSPAQAERHPSGAQSSGPRRPSTGAIGAPPQSSSYERPATSGVPRTPRAVADGQSGTAVRPGTQGSTMSNFARSDSMHLVSRGSYNRPAQAVAPSLASTTAQGRLTQPQSSKPFFGPTSPSGPDHLAQSSNSSRSNFEPPSSWRPAGQNSHKRSSTLSGLGERLLGRSGAFGLGKSTPTRDQSSDRRPSGRLAGAPPTSYQESSVLPRPSRTSTESRRSSFGFGRRGSASGDKPKRFSLIPSSIRNFASGESRGNDGYAPPSTSHSMADPKGSAVDSYQPRQDRRDDYDEAGRNRPATSGVNAQSMKRKDPAAGPNGAAIEQNADKPYGLNQNASDRDYLDDGPLEAAQHGDYSEPVVENRRNYQNVNRPQGGDPNGRVYDRTGRPVNGRPGVLHKPNRKFTEAYENEGDAGYGYNPQHGGSSGAARKVMDFFRRRGRARTGDERG